jgi:hypothetical protein
MNTNSVEIRRKFDETFKCKTVRNCLNSDQSAPVKTREPDWFMARK